MRAMVIYESLTGNTKAAAALIADELRARGVEVTGVSPITAVDYQALGAADLVFVGSWTDGLFLVGQRPGRAGRLSSKLPAMHGKRAAVFCTYAIDPGKVLEKLSTMLTLQGAEVLGGMAIKRTDIAGGARELVSGLLAAVPAG